jgi:hypothetical protein
MENPNPTTGGGFLEHDPACQVNGGGIHCVGNSGCRLCFRPAFGAINVGNRPVCARFAGLQSQCINEGCCLNNQHPNPVDGNGFLEFDEDCLGGGLHCVANSGCKLCYKFILGSVNVGNRPICQRFLGDPPNFNFPPNCTDENCCIDSQNPNDIDGNGFFEFNTECKANGGGLHCIAGSGCRLCYKPVLGGSNIGDRPICQRFLHLNVQCSSEACCLDQQIPNDSTGVGFLEYNAGCQANGGGLHCFSDTGCRLCYKPVLGGSNLGNRPICQRFL